MAHTERLGLAKESYVILAICFLDLVLTLWLVTTSEAVEGNPLMAFYLDHGWVPLVAAKVVLVGFPIFIAEWARRHSPRFVRRMLRFAIAAYIGIYLIALFVDTDTLALGRKPVADSSVNVQYNLPIEGPAPKPGIASPREESFVTAP